MQLGLLFGIHLVDGGDEFVGHFLLLEGLVADSGFQEGELALKGEGLCLHRCLDSGELGVERGVHRVEYIDDSLQLGLLFGIHLVDGLG